jgi:transcriptional regulator with XRE-family HTH domain
MDETNSLGVFLRAAREQKSHSLRAVEKQSGVSNAYLSQLESGKIKQPSPNILHKLSVVYEVPYTDLLELAGYPASDKLSEDQDNSFAARLGPVSEEEQDALLEYLSFLRSRKSRDD